ncbi:MAG: Flp family type IVb pilin [Pseudomonadota bacterium]|nr:Flp family type IVb pilin [Pseudomonadota bacterium]
MLKIITKIQSLKSDSKGATAIEYGLIAAAIAVAIVAIIATVGGDLVAMFTDVSDAL